MWAIDKLSHHLKHCPFYLYSNHKPLTDKMLSACHKKTFAHCNTFIEDHYPIWRYVKGKANVIDDFLSRFHGMKTGNHGPTAARQNGCQDLPRSHCQAGTKRRATALKRPMRERN